MDPGADCLEGIPYDVVTNHNIHERGAVFYD